MFAAESPAQWTRFHLVVGELWNLKSERSRIGK
jgi:hypothetical protein